MRILIEPSDYVLRNVGDMAMLQTAVARLSALWPTAGIQVLTDDPARLRLLCPAAIPLPANGRYIWLGHNFLPIQKVSTRLSPWIRRRAPKVVELLWYHKLWVRG